MKDGIKTEPDNKKSEMKTEAKESSFNTLPFDFSTIHALRMSTNRYRTLFEGAGDAIFVIDWKERILDLNRIACNRLGYSRKELLEMEWQDIEASEEAENRLERFKDLREQGHIIYEAIYTKKDDSFIPIEANCRLIEYDDDQAILIIARDITERKEAEKEKAKLQAQLRQVQKMEALGTLAGGIAHDFNNILTPISGHAELCLFKLGENNTVQKNLEEIINAVDRAKELVYQILAFSRQEEQEKKPFHVHTILKEALKLLRASLPTTIEIRQNIDKCGPVLGNPTQIHQVILNLCTNANYAMSKKGGVLDIYLTEIEIESEKMASYLSLNKGPYLRMTISDTGEGMEPDVLERIFDPYFTTKEEGVGTGMGLSVVHGIVKSHDGHIRAYSEPQKGTTFDIYLPKIESHVIDRKTAAHEALPKGTENILLIDDEQTISEVVEEMLNLLGYTVTVERDGEKALALINEHRNRFDLVITDMTMPKMTGDVLAGKIIEIKPDMPVFLYTGYSKNLTREKFASMGIRDCLTKPPSMKELAVHIRKALDPETSE